MNDELKKALLESYCSGRTNTLDMLIDFLQRLKNDSEKDSKEILDILMEKDKNK